VNVVLPECSDVLRSLAPFLNNLSNLHTLQILFVRNCGARAGAGYDCQHPESAFGWGVLNFPTIKRLTLHTSTASLLRLCPNAEHVRVLGDDVSLRTLFALNIYERVGPRASPRRAVIVQRHLRRVEFSQEQMKEMYRPGECWSYSQFVSI
jgi:hypothetical protein